MTRTHFRRALKSVGPYAELVLRRITAKKTFVSADGIVAGRGLCEATAEQAALKALMLDQTKEVYILADSTKLGDSYSSFWTSHFSPPPPPHLCPIQLKSALAKWLRTERYLSHD